MSAYLRSLRGRKVTDSRSLAVRLPSLSEQLWSVVESIVIAVHFWKNSQEVEPEGVENVKDWMRKRRRTRSGVKVNKMRSVGD